MIKYRKAQAFLGSDIISNFIQDLFIPNKVFRNLQPVIRNNISKWKGQKEYYEQYWRIMLEMSNEFEKINKHSLMTMQWWIDNIFICDGRDRLSEHEWRALSYRCKNGAIHIPGKIGCILSDIGAACIKYVDEVDRRLDMEISQGLSKWDNEIFQLEHIDCDGLFSYISLMASCNKFAYEWRRNFLGLPVKDYISLIDWVSTYEKESDLNCLTSNFPVLWMTGSP